MSCLADNCTKPARALGYCARHYVQFKKHGRVLISSRKEFNEIRERKTYYEIVLTDINSNEAGIAKIDKEDLTLVKSIGRWYLHHSGYVYAKSGSGQIAMHRIVMKASENQLVDHTRPGNKYKSDNRKSKLRIATKSQNGCNRTKQVNNTSGYKGVTWKNDVGKWLAQIKIDGKNKYLGTFVTPEEAFGAYQTAAKALHKEFAYS